MSPVKQCALSLGLTVHQPASLRTPEALELLRSINADALVVVAYGLILPSAALSASLLGCFNIHASLLPRWRGAAPIQRALLAGDAETGVTIMRMDAGLDTGPMLAARAIPLLPGDSAQSVHDRLSVLGADMIVAALDDLASGIARETVQPVAGVTYAGKLSKAEASIDWNEDAAQIVRKVQAFNPWPVAETHLDGVQVRIWEAGVVLDEGFVREQGHGPAADPGRVLAAAPEGIVVACGTGQVCIRRLQLAGRKPLPARDFVNAHALKDARFTGS